MLNPVTTNHMEQTQYAYKFIKTEDKFLLKSITQKTDFVNAFFLLEPLEKLCHTSVRTLSYQHNSNVLIYCFLLAIIILHNFFRNFQAKNVIYPVPFALIPCIFISSAVVSFASSGELNPELNSGQVLTLAIYSRPR